MKGIITALCFLFIVSVYGQEYEPLPLNQIKADGWIEKQMERDITSGYISVYDKLQPSLQKNMFGPVKVKNYVIGADGRQELPKEISWWPGEHEGYFADVVVRNAFLTGNRHWLDKARTILDYVIENQDSTGYIGVYDRECRLDNLLNENGELWTQSRMLVALLAYYEYTGEEKYFDAAKRAADYTIQRFTRSGKTYFCQPEPQGGGLTHGLMFCEPLEWLYRLTGDKRYPKFALWLYQDYNKAEPKLKQLDNQLSNLLDRDLMFKEHTVHTAEHHRVVFWLCSVLGWADLQQACDNIFTKYFLSQAPTGTLVMDPVVHERTEGNYGSAYLPYEYCTIVESVISFESAMQKFGYFRLGDAIENIAFNAGQGARLPSGKGISYSTKDTRFEALGKNGFRDQVGACHKTACCNLQAAKLMPYYVAGMWMKTVDGKGLVSALYGPSRVQTQINGVEVRVKEETMYPFENEVVYTIDPEKERTFDLILRLPAWADGVEIDAPGARVVRLQDRIVLSKKWGKADRVKVVFGDPIRICRFRDNENYFTKGALIYAMKVNEKMEASPKLDYGMANYDVTPANPVQAEWVKALLLPANPAIALAKKPDLYRYQAGEPDKDYPFDVPYGYIRGRFQLNGRNTEGELVPIGSTVLRKTTFKENK